MTLYRVLINHKLDQHRVNQPARSHEEAVAQALLKLGIAESACGLIMVAPNEVLPIDARVRPGISQDTPEIGA